MSSNDLFANVIPFPQKPEGYKPEDNALLGGVVRVISDIHIRPNGFLKEITHGGLSIYQTIDPKLAKFVDFCINNGGERIMFNKDRAKRVLAVVLLGDVVETWALAPDDTTLSDEPQQYDQGMRNGSAAPAMEWRTTKWFFDQMERLLAAGIHVVYVLGNHDDLITKELANQAVTDAYQRAHPNTPVDPKRGKFIYHTNSLYSAGVLYQHGHQYDLFNKRFINNDTGKQIDPVGRQVSRLHEIYSDAASPNFEKGYNLSALGAGLGLAETALTNIQGLFDGKGNEKGVANARASAEIVLNNVLDGALAKLSGDDRNMITRIVGKIFKLPDTYDDKKIPTSLLNKDFRKKWRKIFKQVLAGYTDIRLERGLCLRNYIVGALPEYDFSDMLLNERAFYKPIDPTNDTVYMKFNAYVLVQGHTHLPQLKFHRAAYREGRTHSYCYANTGGWDQIITWDEAGLPPVQSCYVEIEYHDRGCSGLTFINVNTVEFREDGTALPYSDNKLVMGQKKGGQNFEQTWFGVDVYYDTRLPAIIHVPASQVPHCEEPGDIQKTVRKYLKKGITNIADDDAEAERIISLHKKDNLPIWGFNSDGVVDKAKVSGQLSGTLK